MVVSGIIVESWLLLKSGCCRQVSTDVSLLVW